MTLPGESSRHPWPGDSRYSGRRSETVAPVSAAMPSRHSGAIGSSGKLRTRLTVGTKGLTALLAISLLAACSEHRPYAVASNPPPVAPGPNAVWYHVSFDTGSYAISGDGQTVIADVVAYLQRNPASVATIVGRTDTVGGADYNMHLSHQRADAVRDAVVYGNKVAEDRVETRWSGEKRPEGRKSMFKRC